MNEPIQRLLKLVDEFPTRKSVDLADPEGLKFIQSVIIAVKESAPGIRELLNGPVITIPSKDTAPVDCISALQLPQTAQSSDIVCTATAPAAETGSSGTPEAADALASSQKLCEPRSDPSLVRPSPDLPPRDSRGRLVGRRSTGGNASV